MSKVQCPYCGSDHTNEIPNEGCYHCNECGDDFFFEDTIREPMRHRISAILFNKAEKFNREHKGWNIRFNQSNPLEIDLPLSLPNWIGVFETEDGIIFFNPNDGGEPIEFDDMETDSITEILKVLEETI